MSRTASTGSGSAVSNASTGAPVSAAPANASAKPAANGDGKKNRNYEVQHLGVGKANKETLEQLTAIANKLGCRPNALFWEGARRVIANPPTTAPAGAAGPTSAAVGFWVVPTTAPDGRATGIRVVEVQARGQIKNGRTFFRYDREDEKSRGRAERQAIRAGQHDMRLLGLGDGANLKSEKFQTA